VPEVRVVSDDGEQLGVMDTREAIRIARERGMDLVEVAANAEPPVCRITDFGKFQYEAKKKANEAKKKQVVITVKEIKFRPGTDDHDYDYRMKHARDWLNDGDKVKATIWFRGREMAHRELGSRILAKLEADLLDVGEVEMRPRMEGNQMFIILAPKRSGGGGSSGGSGNKSNAPKPDSTPKPEAPAAKPEASAAKPEPSVAKPEAGATETSGNT